MKKSKNLTSLSDFVDNEYGVKGTKKREKFETEYEAFKLGVLIQQARPILLPKLLMKILMLLLLKLSIF